MGSNTSPPIADDPVKDLELNGIIVELSADDAVDVLTFAAVVTSTSPDLANAIRLLVTVALPRRGDVAVDVLGKSDVASSLLLATDAGLASLASTTLRLDPAATRPDLFLASGDLSCVAIAFDFDED